MKNKRILGGLLAFAMLLSGCGRSSDAENSDNSNKWWGNVSTSENSEITNSDNDFDNGFDFVIPEHILAAANNAPTIPITDKVCMDTNVLTNYYVASPLYNCSDDMLIDFGLPADDLTVYAFVDDSNSVSPFNDKIKESCNVTNKQLTIGELIDKNLYGKNCGFYDDGQIAKQQSRISRNMYNYLVVCVEAQIDKYSVKSAVYVIPFTRKGSLDVPSVRYDLDTSRLYFSADTEIWDYKAPEIPDSSTSDNLKRAAYDLTDFDYDVYDERFPELKDENDINNNVGTPDMGLIVSPNYNNELQRLAYRGYDKATGEYSAWCTIDLSQFAGVVVKNIDTPSPNSADMLAAQSVDEWVMHVPTHTFMTTVDGFQYSVPTTYMFYGDGNNAADYLVAPGNTSTNGKVWEGWVLECKVGVRNSTNNISVFSESQDYYILRFPESFTEEDCVSCWEKLAERQKTLTDIWNAEQAKTLGSMDVMVSGSGRRIDCKSYNLSSLCESSDIDEYSGSFGRTPSSPNKNDDGGNTTTTTTTTTQATTAEAPAQTTATEATTKTTTTEATTKATTTEATTQSTTTETTTKTTTTEAATQATTTEATTQAATTEATTQATTTEATTQAATTEATTQATTTEATTQATTTETTTQATTTETTTEAPTQAPTETTTEEITQPPQQTVSPLQEAINNYQVGDTCLAIDMGYGPIKFNGEDLGQMIAAYCMFNSMESFSIPLETFDLDNYYDYAKGNYSGLFSVPEVVMVQNPMVPYYFDFGADYDFERGTIDFYNVKYTSDKETIQKWQPAEYAKAKEIADSIKARNLNDRDTYAAINKTLCDMAEYNYPALDEAGDYRSGIAGTSLTTQAAWSPYGVLCYNTGVCYSYAQAFHLICDMLDMPCISITGTLDGGGHIWNKIKIGGKWYIVDATNNDYGSDDLLSDSLCLIPDYIAAASALNAYGRGTWYIEPYADYSADDGSKDAWENGDIISVYSGDDLLDYTKNNFKLKSGEYYGYKVKYFAVRVDADFSELSATEVNDMWTDICYYLYQEGIVSEEVRWGVERNVFIILYFT